MQFAHKNTTTQKNTHHKKNKNVCNPFKKQKPGRIQRCPTGHNHPIFSTPPTRSTAVGGPVVATRCASEKWSTGQIQQRSLLTHTPFGSCSSATVASRSRRRRFGTWWCTRGTIPFGPSLLSTSEFADGPPVFEKIAPPTEGSLTPKKNASFAGGRRPTSSTSATRARFGPAEGAGRR